MRERVKRPPLERTRPIRSWSDLWAEHPASDAREKPPGKATARLEDVVARSVELGYRVVDEYVRRGQEAAQRLRRGAYDTGALAEDVQGVAGELGRSCDELAGGWGGV